jgi:hypothetical protein
LRRLMVSKITSDAIDPSYLRDSLKNYKIPLLRGGSGLPN